MVDKMMNDLPISIMWTLKQVISKPYPSIISGADRGQAIFYG